jgi:tetratricopeptide (TPR) repeat protein
MSRRIGYRAALMAAGAAVLASCAEVPPAPAPAPVRRVAPVDQELERAVARHRDLVQKAKAAGDLSTAAAHLQILTVLAPGDQTYRRELASTRAAIERQAQERLAAGNAAMKRGETERAADAMLDVLALDPDNAEAAQTLRDIERRHAARTQAARAAKAGGTAMAAPAASRQTGRRAPAPDPADAYDLEQPLEMLAAGDVDGGLRDLHQFVDAHSNDRAVRNQIGNAVYERARELETQGEREQALRLYEEAVSLRGAAAAGWNNRIRSLKKSLGDEYYEKGVKAYPTDPSLAVKAWETSLRYDPQNTKSAARLKDARVASVKTTGAAK